MTDMILDALASAMIAPPLRWLWARYWPRVRAWLADYLGGHGEGGA